MLVVAGSIFGQAKIFFFEVIENLSLYSKDSKGKMCSDVAILIELWSNQQ